MGLLPVYFYFPKYKKIFFSSRQELSFFFDLNLLNIFSLKWLVRFILFLWYLFYHSDIIMHIIFHRLTKEHHGRDRFIISQQSLSQNFRPFMLHCRVHKRKLLNLMLKIQSLSTNRICVFIFG